MNYGNLLTNYQINEIKKLKSGDKLLITDIVVSSSFNLNLKIDNILIKMK